MIVPGTVADWAMFAGLLASLGSLAALGNRWIFKELPAEAAQVEIAVPPAARPARRVAVEATVGPTADGGIEPVPRPSQPTGLRVVPGTAA